MEIAFLDIVNQSIAAGWLILAVLLFRVILYRAPKGLRCVLWAIVGVRLFGGPSIESVWSLIPSTETIPRESLYAVNPTIHSGISVLNTVVNPVISDYLSPNPGDSVNPLQVITAFATLVWGMGIAGMLLYAIISFLKIRSRVKASLLLMDVMPGFQTKLDEKPWLPAKTYDELENMGFQPRLDTKRWHRIIYLCDEISSPFILGILRPRIYLPSSLSEEQMLQVLAHESAHLQRRDHWWKPLGFAILAVYWFHPLVWIAYVLFCRDIEMATDERAISTMQEEERKFYSKVLLECSISRKRVTACPLAFGEVSIKSRIRSVLNYKEPAFWVVAVALLTCIAIGICFLTNPIRNEASEQELTGDSLNRGGSGTGIVMPSTDSMYRCYQYLDSVEPFAPKLLLGVNNNMFQFTYSVFSSYIASGTYEIKGTQLILSTSDGYCCYIFDVEEEGYAFNEKESSKLPKYRYSADGEPKTPVPDGALFTSAYDSGSYVTEDGEVYGYTDGLHGGVEESRGTSVYGDFDKDGKEEQYSLGIGPTSGLYTTRFYVLEEGEITYFNIFRPKYNDMKLAIRKDGTVYVTSKEWKFITGESTFIQEHEYEILFEDGNVVLKEDGECMDYWGEQGLSSPYIKESSSVRY